jgi:hypothetical protein
LLLLQFREGRISNCWLLSRLFLLSLLMNFFLRLLQRCFHLV